MKRRLGALCVAGVAVVALNATGPVAHADGCTSTTPTDGQTADNTIAGPVYGEVDTTGSGYVVASGDQGYVEVTGSTYGPTYVNGSTSDGTVNGSLSFSGTSALPSACVNGTSS